MVADREGYPPRTRRRASAGAAVEAASAGPRGGDQPQAHTNRHARTRARDATEGGWRVGGRLAGQGTTRCRRRASPQRAGAHTSGAHAEDPARYVPRAVPRGTWDRLASESQPFAKKVASALALFALPGTNLAHSARVRTIKHRFERWKPLECPRRAAPTAAKECFGERTCTTKPVTETKKP